MKKIYRGELREGSNGEAEVLLFLAEGEKGSEILAETLESDVDSYGRYLTVSYFISDKPLSANELQEALLTQVLGLGEAKYGVAYSATTGYLWTDEDFNVGGHNLLEELYTGCGKFLHMEIEYNKTEPQP